AILTVAVDNTEIPAKFESKARWGDSLAQPGVGTAWVILLDAASTMGDRFEAAKEVGVAFANSMGANDIADVMLFNDRSVVLDSKWTNKAAAVQFIQSQARTFPTQGRTRPLSNIIINAVTDAFKEQGNAGLNVSFPMHQALVLLSSGIAGADASSGAPAAFALREKLTKGRFPEDNQVLPRTPIPTISVFFPGRQIEEFGANAREYMENLANTELGGFFFIVRNGQAHRAPNIVNAVHTRFNKMH